LIFDNFSVTPGIRIRLINPVHSPFK